MNTPDSSQPGGPTLSLAEKQAKFRETDEYKKYIQPLEDFDGPVVELLALSSQFAFVLENPDIGDGPFLLYKNCPEYNYKIAEKVKAELAKIQTAEELDSFLDVLLWRLVGLRDEIEKFSNFRGRDLGEEERGGFLAHGVLKPLIPILKESLILPYLPEGNIYKWEEGKTGARDLDWWYVIFKKLWMLSDVFSLMTRMYKTNRSDPRSIEVRRFFKEDIGREWVAEYLDER